MPAEVRKLISGLMVGHISNFAGCVFLALVEKDFQSNQLQCGLPFLRRLFCRSAPGKWFNSTASLAILCTLVLICRLGWKDGALHRKVTYFFYIFLFYFYMFFSHHTSPHQCTGSSCSTQTAKTYPFFSGKWYAIIFFFLVFYNFLSFGSTLQ